MAGSPIDDFRPMPLFRSGHRQTILGYFVRKWQRTMPAEERRVLLPDGDTLDIYDSVPPGWKEGGPISIIVHGLGGCHRSGSVLRLAWECYRQQMRVVRMNMRGSGDSMPRARKPYHAGCSEDVKQTVEEVIRWSPKSPLGLVGLSLGGNAVVKMSGETRQESLPTLRQIIAVSPPVDLERCSQMLSEPRNQLYEKRFVQELTLMALQRAKLHQQPAPMFPQAMSLRQFDDLYTASRVGYANVGDYYHRASSKHVLHQVEIPTHIISAEDDPMIDPVPIRETVRSAAVTVQLTRHGGHLGYVSAPGGGAWLEKQIVERLKKM